MKFIISSKYLAIVLSRIDFDNDNVRSVSYNSPINTLTIQTNHTSIDAKVTMISEPLITEIKQGSVRWDMARKLAMSVEEQPITIKISEMTLNITFQY